MTGIYLLDTNILIGFFNKQTSIIARIQSASHLYVPVIVAGELFFGARASQRSNTNLQRYREFLHGVSLLHVDIGTAEIYGDIKANLRKKGRPIPENDIWIAALALQHQMLLVTVDSDFQHVEGLQTENWLLC